MARYEKAFYQPMLSDWRGYENWELAGAKEAGDRATDLWQQALAEYQEPPMDPARRGGTGSLCRQAAGRDRR
jgi:trimethylamine--corrinoid protein Co-methyltransferase